MAPAARAQCTRSCYGQIGHLDISALCHCLDVLVQSTSGTLVQPIRRTAFKARNSLACSVMNGSARPHPSRNEEFLPCARPPDVSLLCRLRHHKTLHDRTTADSSSSLTRSGHTYTMSGAASPFPTDAAGPPSGAASPSTPCSCRHDVV